MRLRQWVYRSFYLYNDSRRFCTGELWTSLYKKSRHHFHPTFIL